MRRASLHFSVGRLRALSLVRSMGHIISVHSYRGGTGKSNIAANLAYLTAKRGHRVAVLDTDLQSPGVHLLFGLEQERMPFTLSDFLFDKCELEDAVYEVGAAAPLNDSGGALFLVPSSMTIESISRVLSEGYDPGKLNSHFKQLMETYDLDVLFLDTPPGLNKETLLTAAVCDALVILIRPDKQDFHGTALLTEMARRLAVPSVYLIANKVVGRLDPDEVETRMKEAFQYEVIGVLGLSEEMAGLGSRGLFCVERPSDPLAAELGRIADRLMTRGFDSGKN